MPTKGKSPKAILFVDGASSGNPGPGGWGAAIQFPNDWVRELGGSESHTTNNRMELTAALRALESVKDLTKSVEIEIYTDSSYVIRGMTQWIWGWKKKGWMTTDGKPVANSDLWILLSTQAIGRKIQWSYVRGHSGIPGNERVDQIAVEFSKRGRPALYDGPLSGYPIDLENVPLDTAVPDGSSRSSGARKPASPHSYLSLVGNQVVRHSTWPECQKRVQGVSGAKFKKAMNPEDEKSILNSWGLDLSVLKNEKP